VSKAKVEDIFFSTQGEGIYAGCPQVFVRFYDCKWNCRFCDTSLTAYEKYSPFKLYNQIKRFTQEYHSLCLTGGEPLLYKDFLKQFLRLIKYDGIPTYLETNGILADELSEIIDDIDIVAMDIKLPSSTGMGSYWKEHKRFLKAAAKKEVFVKMVICSDTELEDIDKAVHLIIKAGAKDIPVVLQPNSFELNKELLAYTRELEKYCLRHLSRVKVIPQLHKITRVK
jgi:7-carboxy-7-deazaguanine synthase